MTNSLKQEMKSIQQRNQTQRLPQLHKHDTNYNKYILQLQSAD